MNPEPSAGTLGVTGRVLSAWALDLLRSWLPGSTGIDDDLGAEFRITFLGPRPNYECVDRYEVTTIDGRDPRRYSLIVVAMEET